MKKILVSVLAVAAMVACSTEHTVVKVENNEAIGFDTFVDKTTRAEDITTTNIANFGVYASVTNSQDASALILTNEKVTKNGDVWGYTNTQHWVPGNSYNFTAIAPFEGRHWTYATGTQAQNGVINFKNNLENAAGEQDLVFAYAERANVAAGAQPKVGLTFSHLLSKVAFKFTNGYAANDNMTLEVYGIKINNAVAEAKVAVENGAVKEWEQTSTATFERTFGKQAAEAEGAGILAATDAYTTEHHYLLPIAQQYSITFTIDLYQAGVKVGQYEHTITPEIAFAKGGNYCISATLNETNTGASAFEPIEFTVEGVNEWENANVVETYKTVEVTTTEDLVAAIEAGNSVKLMSDINLDVTRAAEAGLVLNSDVVIDGNGYTLSTSAVRAIQAIGAKYITVKNLTLNACGERGIQLQGEGQTLLVENVKAVSKNYTLNFTSSCKNATVVVNNSDLKGLNTVNVWASNSNITINNTTLRCEDNATEGYAVVYNAGVNTNVTVNGGEVVITGTKSEGTTAGLVSTSTATVTFNGTEGDCTVKGHNFAINYDNGYRYTFATFAEALETAVAGETIVLLQDITIESHLTINKNVNLDLNGNTITVDVKGGSGDDAIWVRDNAESVISNGAIRFVNLADSTVYASGIFATGTSKLTLENMDVVAGAEAVFAQSNAAVEILSGSYKSIEYPGFTLNLKDSARATASIVVKGGKYFQFNPADNAAEGEHTNFVAAGKTVEQDGDWYIVK